MKILCVTLLVFGAGPPAQASKYVVTFLGQTNSTGYDTKGYFSQSVISGQPVTITFRVDTGPHGPYNSTYLSDGRSYFNSLIDSRFLGGSIDASVQVGQTKVAFVYGQDYRSSTKPGGPDSGCSLDIGCSYIFVAGSMIDYANDLRIQASISSYNPDTFRITTDTSIDFNSGDLDFSYGSGEIFAINPDNTVATSIPFRVDSVLVAVPEPATWAMMILGFGTVGTAIRRRPIQPSFRS